MREARPNRDFQSRKILLRRETLTNLPAHAPPPDLVAIDQNGKLLANLMGEENRTTTAEIAETYRPIRTESVQRKRKRSVENHYRSIPRDGCEDEHEEEGEDGFVDDRQSRGPFSLCYVDSKLVPASNHSAPNNNRKRIKPSAKPTQNRHQPKRLRSKPQTSYRPTRPKLQVITSPTDLELLSRSNPRMNGPPTPSTYAWKPENCSPTEGRRYTPFARLPCDSRATGMVPHQGDDGAGSSPSTAASLHETRKPASPSPYKPGFQEATMLPPYRAPLSPIQRPYPAPMVYQYEAPHTFQYGLPAPTTPYILVSEQEQEQEQCFFRTSRDLCAIAADSLRSPLRTDLNMQNNPYSALHVTAMEDGAAGEYEDFCYRPFAQYEF
ncbi:hypothetical protein DSL72_005948 [Monilinia vaccinii-corymbosi]|uniref:Uncharacterized protein n=1 Tax=Monilinia vaccinii-corymbosi TaxID=61207 RepID=A0A8A3PGG3_9HELO|nr:hypothetical protein DSL72_005948 [Monilinia vaccinii-corymbosi]